MGCFVGGKWSVFWGGSGLFLGREWFALRGKRGCFGEEVDCFEGKEGLFCGE